MTAAGWDETLASALAGTARQPPAGTADPERALLDAAAEHALRRLAGWPARPGLPPPEGDACPPEELPAASPAAALRLAGMLAGDHAELLPEWLALAAGQRVVPPRLLPAVLAHAATRPPLRQAIIDVIGRRGRWLAARVPGWDFAALGDLDAAFATGTRPARLSALRELRRRDPAAALRRLAERWPDESGEDRAALVDCLQVGLGAHDEDFLEAAARDSRKEVRQAALTFLARLPASRLVERMRARVEPMVVYRRGLLGGRLEVAPPERCGQELVDDGIEPRPPQGIGERAWWLSQALGMVRPGRWPVEAAAAAVDTDWAAALLGGWAAAAARFRDARWAEALIVLWTRTWERKRGQLGFSPESILLGLEPADRDAVLVRVIGRSPVEGARLALYADHRWGRDLTRALVEALRGLAPQQAHVATLAAMHLGLRGDPALVAEAERLTDIPSLDHAAADAAEMLHRRSLMAKELST